MSDLLTAAATLRDEMVRIRRDLHRHPELSFQETRTAGVVARGLREMGLEPRTGVGRTGVVADVENGPGPTVLVRADMDALPIQEANTHDFPSTVDGVMHACGHDGHCAGLLGAARLLLQRRESGDLPSGTVRLAFQPSEETVDEEGKSGATRMMEDGLLEGVDAAVAAHLGAHMAPGAVYLSPGPVMGGSEEVTVDVRGRAAHAAFAHEGVDAIVLAAQGIGAVQTAVSRRIAPTETGVVSFGRIQGGQASNILADHVHLHGTLRYFEPHVKVALEETIRGAFGGLEALGARSEVRFRPGYPPVVNHGGATALVAEGLGSRLGADRLRPLAPALTAEDFAFFAQEVPGVFFWVGAALAEPRSHHHPAFDFDEDALPLAAAALAGAAEALLLGVG